MHFPLNFKEIIFLQHQNAGKRNSLGKGIWSTSFPALSHASDCVCHDLILTKANASIKFTSIEISIILRVHRKRFPLVQRYGRHWVLFYFIFFQRSNSWGRWTFPTSNNVDVINHRQNSVKTDFQRFSCNHIKGKAHKYHLITSKNDA